MRRPSQMTDRDKVASDVNKDKLLHCLASGADEILSRPGPTPEARSAPSEQSAAARHDDKAGK